ncbi:MAG: PP2C family protein-serine/threonine phosphatase [Acidimicrobiales bacterium]
MNAMAVALLLAGGLSALAAFTWGRSARVRRRLAAKVARDFGADADAAVLSRATWHKDAISALTWSGLTVALIGAGLAGPPPAITGLLLLLAAPAVASLVIGRGFARQARISQDRWQLERKAEETLEQDELAPKRWAERLAPETLPALAGFEIGRVYQAGTGMMAGDFYDVYPLSRGRLAVVIGDVTGHGIEASITAFQAKYLLRVFLNNYRDPAQALEELNKQLSSHDRAEEFISMCAVVLDPRAQTLRYASAGHPAMWLWHERDLQPLRATGPLITLDPGAEYTSREIDMDEGDLIVLYTDGLAEARAGAELFGEERIAAGIRRDPGALPDVMCKDLLEQARQFATADISDDVAILAIRRI